MKKNVNLFIKSLHLTAILFALLTASCQDSLTYITVPDITVCTAAGKITNGADCGTTTSNIQTSMTGDQYIAWLNPSANKPSAICQSADDFGKLITAAEELCTALKSHCTNNNKLIIKNMKSLFSHSMEHTKLREIDPE